MRAGIALALCYGYVAAASDNAWSLKDTTKSIIEPSFWVAEADPAPTLDSELTAQRDEEHPLDETAESDDGMVEHKKHQHMHVADEHTRRALADEMDTVFEQLEGPSTAVAVSREVHAHKRPSKDDEEHTSIVDAEAEETTAFGQTHPDGHHSHHNKKTTDTTSELAMDEPRDVEEEEESTEEMMVVSPSVYAHSSRSNDDDENDYIPIFSESPDKKKKKHHTREEVESLETGQHDPAAVHTKKAHHHQKEEEQNEQESPAMRFLQKLLSDVPDSHTHHNHTHITRPAEIKEHNPEVEAVDTTPHKKKHHAVKEEETSDASFTAKSDIAHSIAHKIRHPFGGGKNETKVVEQTHT